MEKVNLTEGIDMMKPVWTDYIIELGYTEEQGKLFADGYADGLNELSTLEKVFALENQHDSCMTAGFIKAGIDEDEAYKKHMASMTSEEGD